MVTPFFVRIFTTLKLKIKVMSRTEKIQFTLLSIVASYFIIRTIITFI